MSIILVSDIFGRAAAFKKIAATLGADILIDPYSGFDQQFTCEDQAYEYFSQHVGLDAYTAEVAKAIKTVQQISLIIGFSIGASAIWRLSDKLFASNIERAICYYGSQIRNFIDIQPNIEIQLIFPYEEAHFDVAELQSKLVNKANIKITKANYLHGFMNEHSDNFNQTAYQTQLKFLLSLT